MDGGKPHIEKAEAIKMGEVPAIGLSLNVNLGAGRVLVVQTHVDPDSLVHSLDGTLDAITKAADRQKAKYEIVEIDDELRRMKLMQGDRQRDLEKINEGLELEAIRKEGDEAAQAHMRSGRRTEYKPNDNYIRRLKSVMENHERNKKTAQLEYDRHTNEIERLEHEIEKRRKIVAGG